MLRLAALLCIFGFPVLAEVPCGGIADVMTSLAQNGFRPSDGGKIDGGTVTIYTHANGRFVVIYMNDAQACLVQTGTAWGPIKPNA